MPAALNIQPLKRGSVGSMTAHIERTSEPEEHIDQSRTHLNKTLVDRRDEFPPIPRRQPTTGRKIRRDANVMASVICTLPKELDADNPDHVRQWSETTAKWLQEHMPGKVELIELHMDETTPHVHALIRPIDERGHLSWQDQYHSRVLLRNLQASYAAALAPMGVLSNTREVKEELSKSYTKGIHGWRARKTLTALQQERAELREALAEASERAAERERVIEDLTALLFERAGEAGHDALVGDLQRRGLT